MATFDFASMNLTPWYEIDRIMMGTFPMVAVDFWKDKINNIGDVRVK